MPSKSISIILSESTSHVEWNTLYCTKSKLCNVFEGILFKRSIDLVYMSFNSKGIGMLVLEREEENASKVESASSEKRRASNSSLTTTHAMSRHCITASLTCESSSRRCTWRRRRLLSWLRNRLTLTSSETSN